MNPKFKFIVTNGVVLMDDEVKARRTKYIRTLPDGIYEDIVRAEIKWDTDQMRKYFHGPVLKFVVEQFKVLGYAYGKEDVKHYLKDLCGLRTANKFNMLKSTSEYDFKTYVKFLNDINAWCITIFECELPPSDEVDSQG